MCFSLAKQPEKAKKLDERLNNPEEIKVESEFPETKPEEAKEENSSAQEYKEILNDMTKLDELTRTAFTKFDVNKDEMLD